MKDSKDWKKFDIAYQCENKPKQLTFKQWLKACPIITELFGDLPESYLRLMHYQDLNRGNQ
mgnify:CR=1 FL=1|tara:strand:- start:2757 stop:2939 length:183 start_codon:yes stop_codon:yes gene_type:complete